MLLLAVSRLPSQCARSVSLKFLIISGMSTHLSVKVSGNMASVVKGMDKAMDSMNLERVSI